MKKILKAIILAMNLIILMTVIDVSLILIKGKPLFATKDNNIYHGLFYDTYDCKEFTNPQIKSKWTNFKCEELKINTNNEETYDQNISMTIKEGTLSNTGATIIITDENEQKNTFGEEYTIDKKINDKWEKLTVIFEGNYSWNMIGYKVTENNKFEMKINWELLYGKLEPGTYRIIKSATGKSGTSYTFNAEFTIK